MGKIIRNGVEFSGAVDAATAVSYDGSVSGLNAQTVQEAIDELSTSGDYVLLGTSSTQTVTQTAFETITLSESVNNFKTIKLIVMNSDNIHIYNTFDLPIKVLKNITSSASGYATVLGDKYCAQCNYISDTQIGIKQTRVSTSDTAPTKVEIYGIKFTGSSGNGSSESLENLKFCVPNYSKPISGSEITTPSGSWVATQDCFVICHLKQKDKIKGGEIYINNTKVASIFSYNDNESSLTTLLPVKKGQTISTRDTGEYNLIAYEIL